MTVADRSVIFLVVAGLAAITIASIGVVEKNQAFQDEMFELRAREIANVIDAINMYERGYMTMHFRNNFSITFDNSQDPTNMTVDKSGADAVKLGLDAKPDTTSVQGEVICISKTTDYSSSPPSQELKLEQGEC